MLDPRLLRSFVAIVDTGHFTRAAERLGMTQSTISQQLGRLEESAGHPLIDRAARPVRPTAMGERLLGHARRILQLDAEAQSLLKDPAGTAAISIGVPEDLATRSMAQGLARFAASNSRIRLDVVTGLSRDLASRYRQGEFDIVVVKEDQPAPDCRASFPEPLGWFAAPEGAVEMCDPLPLVTFPVGGLYRETMFRELEAAGLRWYVAFSGSSLQSVLAAVSAGMGLSLLPLSVTPGQGLRRLDGMGQAAPMVVSLYAREDNEPIGALVELIQAVLATR
ncbi:LysR family transcriptional regulator [Novosphingobium sp. TCA1]|uniref:LuxR family transcriptional regulator n=1 Tax=Novosphingobium pentaromativorans TaxID=205844 RepID=A0A2W5NFD6_9SPHN|nr:LysR family transcriptional regulator [Novosphingobium sp. TCA1]PZQ51168.1 MAG: LuxR family transcriptional regulator [Novosphingobium pentaromativorans]GFE76999.1 transcriptional regulator [Novosphingobium sp. TCA1]